MAISNATIADTAGLLEAALEGIDGLRVYPYVADTFRPPGAVIGLPTVDYTDVLSGFCGAAYDHDIVIVVSRNSDREAQRELSRWVAAVVTALRDHDTPPGVSIEPQTATPGPINVNGQEMPGYTIRVVVRA